MRLISKLFVFDDNNMINRELFDFTNRVYTGWIAIRQAGRCLDEFFVKQSIKSIAIYGMGNMGCRLYEELDPTEIAVAYTIDRRGDDIELPYMTKIYTLEDDLPDVDMVVVALHVSKDGDVFKTLRLKMKCPILRLDDVIESLIWVRQNR